MDCSMTRAEIEAAAKAQRGEGALLVLAIGVLLDIRDLVTHQVSRMEEFIMNVKAIREEQARDRESRDSAWTRAKPETKPQRRGSG